MNMVVVKSKYLPNWYYLDKKGGFGLPEGNLSEWQNLITHLKAGRTSSVCGSRLGFVLKKNHYYFFSPRNSKSRFDGKGIDKSLLVGYIKKWEQVLNN